MFSKQNFEPESTDIRDRAYDLFGELLAKNEITDILAELGAEQDASDESEAFLKRCDERSMKVIDQYSQKERTRRLFFQTLPHMGRIAAVVIAVIALAGCTAFAASETVRTYLFMFLIQTTDEYTHLSLIPNESEYVDIPVEWSGSYYPTYIPEGLVPVSVDDHDVCFSYGETRPLLVFGEYDENSVVQIDTEGAETRLTMIHGQPAYISTKNTSIKIYWSEGTRYFVMIFRDMSEQIAMSVAESVTQIR